MVASSIRRLLSFVGLFPDCDMPNQVRRQCSGLYLSHADVPIESRAADGAANGTVEERQCVRRRCCFGWLSWPAWR